MTDAGLPAPADEVETLDIDGEILIWTGETLHLLTGQGAQIWQRIDGLSTAEEIAEDLAATFDGPAAAIERDVVSFIDELLQIRVLESVTIGPGPRYAIPDDVGYVRDADIVVLGRFGPGLRRTLSPTAARIWELAGDRHSNAEIVAALRGEFPDAPTGLEHDVQEVLDQLVAAGLLIQFG